MRHSLLATLVMLSAYTGTAAQAQTPTTSDWSGSYVGGSFGAASHDTDTSASAPLKSSGSYFTTPDDVQIGNSGNGSFSDSDFSGSVFGGYQKLYGSTLVGFEVSASSLNVDESRTSSAVYESAPASSYTLTQEVSSDWQGSLRLRLGHVQNNWMAYVTGGAALAEVDVSTTFADDLGTGATGAGSNSETQLGWTLGVGGEYAINKHWALRGEYLYSDFGSVDAEATVTNPDYSGMSNTLTNSVELKTELLTFGVVYRF